MKIMNNEILMKIIIMIILMCNEIMIIMKW